MRGSRKVRDWQKVKERQTPCGTQRLDKSHPPKPCRVSLKGVRQSLFVGPVVCLYWLTRSSRRLHIVPYGPSQTHTTFLLLHTHVAAGRSGNCSSAQHLQDYSTQHFCQSERGACFFHWWITELGKQQRASLRVSKWLWRILGTYYPTRLMCSWTTQGVHLMDLKRWNTSRWLFKLKLCWDNDRWISTRC